MNMNKKKTGVNSNHRCTISISVFKMKCETKPTTDSSSLIAEAFHLEIKFRLQNIEL